MRCSLCIMFELCESKELSNGVGYGNFFDEVIGNQSSLNLFVDLCGDT